MRRRLAFVLLVAAGAGLLFFSQRLGWVDTVAMLACGAAAGCALAMLATRRS